MNILYQEAISMEIHPTIITVLIVVSLLIFMIVVSLLIFILFLTVLAEDYPVISVILIVGSVIGIIVGCKFSCVITPPETHYWVDSDTISKEELDKYELIEQKGKIYILKEIEQAK